MKMVRFLSRAFHMGRIIEPGEEVLMPDDVPLGSHMVDVRADAEAVAAGAEPASLPVPETPQPVFRADLSHTAAMPIADPVVMPALAPEGDPSGD